MKNNKDKKKNTYSKSIEINQELFLEENKVISFYYYFSLIISIKRKLSNNFNVEFLQLRNTIIITRTIKIPADYSKGKSVLCRFTYQFIMRY